MNILIVGASQGTGALCVKSALARGRAVSAFARTPSKLDLTHPALAKVAGEELIEPMNALCGWGTSRHSTKPAPLPQSEG